jgi:hypothetical protein
MSKRGRGGSSGGKFRIALAMPVGAVMNCADNTGAKVHAMIRRTISCTIIIILHYQKTKIVILGGHPLADFDFGWGLSPV